MIETVGVTIAAQVFSASFAAHIARPVRLLQIVRLHQVLPRWSAAPVVILVLAAELTLAAGAWIQLAGGLYPTAGHVLLGSSAYSLLLGAYALVGSKGVGSGWVPCGCDASETPLTPWVTVRAASLAGLFLMGATIGPPMSELEGLQKAYGLLAGIGLAVPLWLLPRALAQAPDPISVRVGVQT